MKWLEEIDFDHFQHVKISTALYPHCYTCTERKCGEARGLTALFGKIGEARNRMTKKMRKLPPVRNRADIVRRLAKHNMEIKSFKVTRLELFGSAARDELRKRSDIDMLVEFSILDTDNYFGLKFFLEDLLGRKIDLVREKAIKPGMMPYVQEDLYAVTP